MTAGPPSTSSSGIAHDETLMRMAVCPCQIVPPHQQVPSAWIAAITRLVVSASPNDTSTWLSTTSFSTLQPAAASPSAKRRAWRQVRSIRSANPVRWSGGGPQPEGAIDMHPCPRVVSASADLLKRVERPGIDVASLEANDRGPSQVWQSLGTQTPLLVHRQAHHAVAPQPQQAERFEESWMRLAAGDNGDRRRAEQAVGLDVPAGPCKQHV